MRDPWKDYYYIKSQMTASNLLYEQMHENLEKPRIDGEWAVTASGHRVLLDSTLSVVLDVETPVEYPRPLSTEIEHCFQLFTRPGSNMHLDPNKVWMKTHHYPDAGRNLLFPIM